MRNHNLIKKRGCLVSLDKSGRLKRENLNSRIKRGKSLLNV